MDKRSTSIMNEIVINKKITDEVLLTKFNISKRQLDYSVKKINDWLYLNQHPPIVKRQKVYEINSKTIKVLEKSMDLSLEYTLSVNERMYLTILLILSRQEAINLLILTDTLLVSKNTVLKDLVEVKKFLKVYQLELVYVRLGGYIIQGNEWDKRRIISDLIRLLSLTNKGLALINRHLEINEIELTNIRRDLILAEQKIGFSFTDQTLTVLPIIMTIFLRRIESAKIIDVDFPLESEELADTREYQVAKHLLKIKFEEISKAEKIYLTLHLLSSQSQGRDYFENKLVSELTHKMEAFVRAFESQSAIIIHEKDQLIQKLLNHFIPAYYRITYNLTTGYQSNQTLISDFKNIHLIVKRSTKPLDEFLKRPIPEEELVYLSLILGGHILGGTFEFKAHGEIRAVIVCPQGVTMSQLLEFELRQLFPEFTFYPAMSIRDFNKSQQKFDVVFSTVAIETTGPLYVISSEMVTAEKDQLRHELQGLLQQTINLAEIEMFLEVIKKHALIKDESKLRLDISQMLQKPMTSEGVLKKDLLTLLPSSNIQVVKSVTNWQEAIKIATKPLLEQGKITLAYRQMLSEKIEDILGYAVLYRRLALPHLGPEDGVNQLSMSLLIVEEGILSPKGERLNLVLVVTPIDKESHLEGLLKMSDFVQDELSFKKIIKAKSGTEAFEIIKQKVQE